MDYNRPLNASKDNPKVHIGILLVPGKHNGTKKTSTSPLLLNPGGPGGSGVSIAMAFGAPIQEIVGEDQDIIGFDPRGISTTTPRADCYSYPSEDLDDGEEDYVLGHYHRFLWRTAGKEIGLVNSSSVALQKIDNRARGIGKLCQTKDELHGDDSILKYVSTPNVARDMLSIVDAWDDWTATLDAASHCSEKKEEAPNSNEEHESIQGTQGQLVYWGFSYGVSHRLLHFDRNLMTVLRHCSAQHLRLCSQTELVE